MAVTGLWFLISLAAQQCLGLQIIRAVCPSVGGIFITIGRCCNSMDPLPASCFIMFLLHASWCMPCAYSVPGDLYQPSVGGLFFYSDWQTLHASWCMPCA